MPINWKKKLSHRTIVWSNSFPIIHNFGCVCHLLNKMRIITICLRFSHYNAIRSENSRVFHKLWIMRAKKKTRKTKFYDSSSKYDLNVTVTVLIFDSSVLVLKIKKIRKNLPHNFSINSVRIFIFPILFSSSNKQRNALREKHTRVQLIRNHLIITSHLRTSETDGVWCVCAEIENENINWTRK